VYRWVASQSCVRTEKHRKKALKGRKGPKGEEKKEGALRTDQRGLGRKRKESR